MQRNKESRVEAMAGVFVFGGWPLFHYITSLGMVHPEVVKGALKKINEISH